MAKAKAATALCGRAHLGGDDGRVARGRGGGLARLELLGLVRGGRESERERGEERRREGTRGEGEK
jgi:hypothetical protein